MASGGGKVTVDRPASSALQAEVTKELSKYGIQAMVGLDIRDRSVIVTSRDPVGFAVRQWVEYRLETTLSFGVIWNCPSYRKPASRVNIAARIRHGVG